MVTTEVVKTGIDSEESRLIAVARLRGRMGTCAHEQLQAAETDFYKRYGRYPGERKGGEK